MKTFQLIFAILLAPFTVWYAVGVALRNLYYDHRDKQKLSTVNCQLSTIGIGNLRMGGTGKTPHTEYLIRFISNIIPHNSKTSLALLSRGYKRQTKGFVLADDNSSAAQIGDEPLMMHRKFPNITVAVCEDRAEGLRQLLNTKDKNPDSKNNNHVIQNIVLLDDVYQHRSVKPSLMILLTEYGDLYTDDHILPFGDLREFRSGSHRADIIVVTKCPPFLSTKKRDNIRSLINPLPHQKLFFSYISYSDPVPLFPEQVTPGNEYAAANNLMSIAKSHLLLVSGIANPAPLKRHLERHCSVRHITFPDHHDFTRLDCELIIRHFNNIHEPSKAIVTTEKDAMRLVHSPHRHLFDNIPFFYIPIEVKFFEQNEFNSAILDFFYNFANLYLNKQTH